jgi:hypothetical protein
MLATAATHNKYKTGLRHHGCGHELLLPALRRQLRMTRALPFKVAIDNTGAVAKAWVMSS